jgi:hypothetical protein
VAVLDIDRTQSIMLKANTKLNRMRVNGSSVNDEFHALSIELSKSKSSVALESQVSENRFEDDDDLSMSSESGAESLSGLEDDDGDKEEREYDDYDNDVDVEKREHDGDDYDDDIDYNYDGDDIEEREYKEEQQHEEQQHDDQQRQEDRIESSLATKDDSKERNDANKLEGNAHSRKKVNDEPLTSSEGDDNNDNRGDKSISQMQDKFSNLDLQSNGAESINEDKTGTIYKKHQQVVRFDSNNISSKTPSEKAKIIEYDSKPTRRNIQIDVTSSGNQHKLRGKTQSKYESPRSIERAKSLLTWQKKRIESNVENTSTSHSPLQQTKKDPEPVTHTPNKMKRNTHNLTVSVPEKNRVRIPKTQYDSPRSNERKKSLLEWQEKKNGKSHVTRQQTRRLPSKNLAKNTNAVATSVPEKDRMSSKPLKGDMIMSPRIQKKLRGTAHIESPRNDLDNSNHRSKDRKNVSNPQKFRHVQSKLHSPTAASRSRKLTIARDKADNLLDRNMPMNLKQSPSPSAKMSSLRKGIHLKVSMSSPRTRTPLKHSPSPTARMSSPRKSVPFEHPQSPRNPRKHSPLKQSQSPTPTPSTNKSDPIIINGRESPVRTSTSTHEDTIKPVNINTKAYPKHSMSQSKNSPMPQQNIKIENDIVTVENNREIVVSLISSDDSEGDVQLNSYQRDETGHKAQMLLKGMNKKIENDCCPKNNHSVGEQDTQMAPTNDDKKPFKTGSTSMESDKFAFLGNILDYSRCCSFERLSIHFGTSNNIIKSQSNVENDHLKGSEQISTESMQNSTDSKLSCAQKEMVIDKNFLEEWPNEATEKNKKAKVIIEQACKTKDVDAMIQICHKFREEFMVARFYIGVLMMEKEELEKKLTSLDDSLKDFVDDHNMTLNENHQLKEEILDLHFQLDNTDANTQSSMISLEREMSETLHYALNKAKKLQKELEMSQLKKRLLEAELNKTREI